MEDKRRSVDHKRRFLLLHKEIKISHMVEVREMDEGIPGWEDNERKCIEA